MLTGTESEEFSGHISREGKLGRRFAIFHGKLQCEGKEFLVREGIAVREGISGRKGIFL